MLTMSQDLNKVSRSVYTVFALLGEVGGLYGLFVSAASTLLSVIDFAKAENYLVSRLYSNAASQFAPVEPPNPLKAFLQSCLPSCCRWACLKEN